MFNSSLTLCVEHFYPPYMGDKYQNANTCTLKLGFVTSPLALKVSEITRLSYDIVYGVVSITRRTTLYLKQKTEYVLSLLIFPRESSDFRK